MLRFIIDSCLPGQRIAEWTTAEYIHQRALEGDTPAHDFTIWRYALANNLTIITKDRDFADLILPRTPPPRVILLRTGSMRLAQMQAFISRNWAAILAVSAQSKLVYVFPEFFQGID